MRRLIAVGLLLLPVSAFAQPDRYELGRRAHSFEVAWDATTDPAGRKRAVAHVNNAVRAFLGLNLTTAAKELDAGRHALRSADPAPPAVRWADSLQVAPETHAVDAAAPDLVVVIKSFYKPDGETPEGATVRLKLGNGTAVEAKLDTLPKAVKVPVQGVPGSPSADFKLTAEFRAGDQVLSTRTIGVSRVERFRERLAAVQRAFAGVPNPPKTIEQATFGLLVKMLGQLANQIAPETDVPTARLMAGAERLATVTEPYYIPKRGGEFWLGIPVNNKTSVIRIRIPPKLDERKGPVPVVVALHGMGGSENVYFDGYGNGIVPRLASEHGWIVVGTRVDGLLGAGPAPPVAAVLDELAKRYPIDPKRVYLIGHSMGAGHAVQLAQQHPGRFAAVAALGGGGAVTTPEAVKGTRFFIGCGKLDFALETGRRLRKALDAAGAPVTLKEYDNVEHLLIIREAAEDVFKFFEQKD